jgi:hypothetical protein
MPDDQAANPPIDTYQGSFDNFGEDHEIITLKNSGHFVLGSHENDEWVNFPWEWYYPHVCANMQEFFSILHNFVCYRPLSCKLRLYNLQTTGQVGTNDFAGAPRATEMLTFTDTIGVTGRGLVQPPHLQKAFTELYEDNSFMTRGFNQGAAKKWDTFLVEKLHAGISSDFIPYEGSPNINVVPTNVGQDISWNFDMPNDSVPRSTVEFFVQKNKSANDKEKNAEYYRFDNTHHKIFSANDVHANMGSLLGTRFKDGKDIMTFPMSQACTTIQFEHMVRC